MNIAILGGSFNPPHVAHVLSATWVLSVRPVDEVWLMPVGQHAFGKGLESFSHRARMCELAAAPLNKVRVTDIERRLGGENRTIDTLKVLEQERPDARFSLIIGADILLEAHLWKAWDVLERDYGFHVLGREGYPMPEDQDVQVELPEISSTDIREKLARGDLDGCRGRLSLSVLDYIREHGLYNLPQGR